jgi:uncharacterized protein (UPF0276 family)
MPQASPVVRGNRFGLPHLGIGIGLRSVHYQHVLEAEPAIDWFEIISDNYMQTAGRPLHILDQISERYPIAMHGVSLSIGSTDPLDLDYVRGLRALRERCHARWVSDHLCWTGVLGRNSHDLLPMPLSEESLEHTASRIEQVQDMLGVPLMLENPSTYVEFAASTMSEWEFLHALCDKTGCGLLLDVNNIYVSSRNHGFKPVDYLNGVPWDRVVQFHVAGHTDNGSHCVDTHIGPVPNPVWEILKQAHQRYEGASVLLEWDAEIPTFDVVHRDALRARRFIAKATSAA